MTRVLIQFKNTVLSQNISMFYTFNCLYHSNVIIYDPYILIKIDKNVIPVCPRDFYLHSSSRNY